MVFKGCEGYCERYMLLLTLILIMSGRFLADRSKNSADSSITNIPCNVPFAVTALMSMLNFRKRHE